MMKGMDQWKLKMGRWKDSLCDCSNSGMLRSMRMPADSKFMAGLAFSGDGLTLAQKCRWIQNEPQRIVSPRHECLHIEDSHHVIAVSDSRS